jgi:hypothetical protein
VVLRQRRAGAPRAGKGAVAVPLEEELAFVYRVPEAHVVVTYYVLVHERLMLVKEIEGVRPDAVR